MIGLPHRTKVYRTGSVKKSDEVLKHTEVKYVICGFAFDSAQSMNKLSFQYKRQEYNKF